MTAQEEIVAERLKPLLVNAFPDADVETIDPETVAEDVMGWDSMAHVTLIVDIEEAFDISFTPEEITGFANIGELIALIASKMNPAVA